MARIGDWIQTYTGRQFWPLDPRPEDTHIEDIAHALSMLCRFGGHCLRFYSVAEHSLHVSRIVSPENALTALMHDAGEAYLVDVPRPIKRSLVGYDECELRVWAVIAERYGIPMEIPPEVKDADKSMLRSECQQAMSKPPAQWSNPGPSAKVALSFMSPGLAEREFLERFRELYQGE